MFNFEKLEVWKDALQFADHIYRSTRDFPDHERFGLTSQMRRAAVSIASNLAEGSARSSRVDFSRFIEIATGSLYEVIAQCAISAHQGWLKPGDHEALRAEAEKLSRMLSGLRRSLKAQGQVES